MLSTRGPVNVYCWLFDLLSYPVCTPDLQVLKSTDSANRRFKIFGTDSTKRRRFQKANLEFAVYWILYIWPLHSIYRY